MSDAALSQVSETIRVNGQAQPFSTDNLVVLLSEREIDPAGRGIAVALNGAVVPRAAWGKTMLKPGDAVEIVLARQGG